MISYVPLCDVVQTVISCLLLTTSFAGCRSEMRSMSRICDALGSCFFCVSELCLVASVRRWVPARTQARVYALARGVRKWSHGSWHITASPPRCCMVSMRVRFQDTESCEALKGAAGRRVHGVLERRKVKPGARSIQVTPLIAKKGDGWLGSKAHGFLHALKESDTVLSLLIVTDMVAAWRYRQLVFLLKRWGMSTVHKHVVGCKVGIFHPCIRICQANDIAQRCDETAL